MQSKVWVLLGILWLLAACTVPSKVVSEVSPEPAVPATFIKVVKEKTPLVLPPVIPAVISEDPALAALLLKNKDATNLHYIFDAEKVTGYEIYLRGGKAKKIYTDTKFLRNEVYYNKVFLDWSSQQAVGICDKLGISCSSIWNKAYQVPFESEGIYATPAEVVQRVRYGREVGSEFFDDRKLKIIEFVNREEKRERLSVDPYYGLPLRQVIFAADNTMEEQHTFINLEVGQIKESEVTVPTQYALVR